MFKSLIKGASYTNLFALLALGINKLLMIAPELAHNPIMMKIIAFQALLGMFLPGPFGLGHKLAFGEIQDPANRTVSSPTGPAANSPLRQGVTPPK